VHFLPEADWLVVRHYFRTFLEVKIYKDERSRYYKSQLLCLISRSVHTFHVRCIMHSMISHNRLMLTDKAREVFMSVESPSVLKLHIR
jgi:hypothetical protein